MYNSFFTLFFTIPYKKIYYILKIPIETILLSFRNVAYVSAYW